MSRYELSISINYVESWGIWEGLRELTQNTLDQHKEKDDYSIDYSSSNKTLIFTNINAKLNISSLLLGTSTKTNNSSKIGQFGEGFKLAFLVLLRNGLSVTVNNGNEIWTPKIIKSRRYNSQLLVVDVTKGNKKNKDLQFVVEGVTPRKYAEFTDNFLQLDYPEHFKSEIGNVITKNIFSKKIFVSGLYVGKINNEGFKYGYDFNPKYITLDRDRKKLDSFNVAWTASQLLAGLDKTDFIFDGIKKEYADFEHISQFSYSSPILKDLRQLSHSLFLEKHGVNAVPVRCQEDADIIRRKYNTLVPIVVNKTIHHYIIGSEPYKNSSAHTRTQAVEKTPYSIIQKLLERNKHTIFGKAKLLIEKQLLGPSINWHIDKG